MTTQEDKLAIAERLIRRKKLTDLNDEINLAIFNERIERFRNRCKIVSRPQAL